MIGGSPLQHDIMISPAMILSHNACQAVKDQTGQTTKQMPKGHQSSLFFVPAAGLYREYFTCLGTDARELLDSLTAASQLALRLSFTCPSPSHLL